MTVADTERPGPRLTDEQRRAVERRDGALLLSANAGSGKTTVLAERFVRSVLDDAIEPGRLLAITFTEKAAGELRARLRRRFAELGERGAARDVEAAWVSTIHGFCARVLRSHAVAAGLDPAFVVLEASAARAARQHAWETALAEFLDDADGPRDAALDVVAAFQPDRLQGAIGAVHDELRSRGLAPTLPDTRPARTIAQAREDLVRAHDVLAAELDHAGAGASLDAARAATARCAQLLADETDADGVALTFARRGKALQTEACDAYLAAVAALEQAEVDAAAAPVMGLLDELLGRYADAYAAVKRARGALDFDDLELGLRDLFAAAPAVADAYAERFDRIMVDEYQDTNPLQVQLIARLDRGNVFRVGDELQSIYGFRHADVDVFRRARREHADRGEADTLAINWRAQPELLHTINAAFGAAHDDYVPLVPGREPIELDAAPRTELIVVDSAAFEEDTLDEVLADRLTAGMPDAPLPRLAEARAVARRVRTLLDAERRAPGDVAILLRAATDLHVFERALEQEGLPTLATGGRGFWLRQAVQDICAHLAALANPADTLALYSTLGSPLVGATSDALAIIALAARRRGVEPWTLLRTELAADGAHHTGALADLPPADRDRLAAWLARFEAERAGAPRRSLDELIGRVVTATGYDLALLRQPGGARRLANVHKLERLAASFEARSGRDLRAFVDHATAELEAEAREPEAPIDPGDDSAVGLMTIHAAKGLEFDVVVLADLGRQRNAQHPPLLVGDGEAGLRLARLGGKPVSALAYDKLKAIATERELAEELRILHVGLTRARERLILSCARALAKGWGAKSSTAPPIAHVGASIDPELPARLAEAEVVDVDETRGEWRLRVRATRVAPDTAPATLGLNPFAAGQLAMDLDGGAAAATPPMPAASGAPAGGGDVTPPPAAALELPDALSYSSLSAYDRCPYRFYLQRVLRLPADPDDRMPRTEVGGIEARTRGSIVHELLEALDLEEPELPDDAALDACAERLGVEALSADERADLRGLVATFVEHPLRARLGDAADVKREHGFAFALGDVLLNGYVDLRAREADGTALVVDYKTDRLEPGADLEALVAADYDVQRRIYALAELRAGAPGVEVVHLFLERPAEPVVFTATAADADALAATLRERWSGLLAGRFPVSSTPHATLCQGCPGRATLCSHPREATEREHP